MVLEKPDILVSFMAEPNFRATIAKMGTGVKSIFSVRSSPHIEYRGKLAFFLAKTLFRFGNSAVFQTNDG